MLELTVAYFSSKITLYSSMKSIVFNIVPSVVQTHIATVNPTSVDLSDPQMILTYTMTYGNILNKDGD